MLPPNPFVHFFCLPADEAAGTSEEELSCGEVEASESQESSGAGRGRDQDLKGMLLRKYSGYLSSLRKEFLKTKKKGKLPKDARMILLDWWSNHYRWPYPTVITCCHFPIKILFILPELCKNQLC